VANVADEVEGIVDRYHPERLWYADDVFAIHRGWTLSYAAELERRGLRLPFECISRAERIDDDVADAPGEPGLLPGVDRIRKRLATRPRCDEAQGHDRIKSARPPRG
jgi:hypothetical protein